MVLNLTRPVTAASFSSVPYQDGPIQRAYDANVKSGAFDGMTLKEVREEFKKAKRTKSKAIASIESLEKELHMISGAVFAYEDMDLWVKGFLTFEKPKEHSFLSFQSAMAANAVFNLYDIKLSLPIDDYQKEVFDDSMVFVIEHNWYEAISRADEFASGSFRLPYEVCIFEFRLSHKSVVAICSNYASEGTENEIVMQVAVEAVTGWALTPSIYRHISGNWEVLYHEYNDKIDSVFLRLINLIGNQIRAACIALDAEVATSKLVRAVHSGDETKGQPLPEYEYYTISLAHRERAEALQSSGEVKGVKRLHFRRGHWRHYLTSKTWVRWCLVGNPELGFIDKKYRL